jgi:hypothetical protein
MRSRSIGTAVVLPALVASWGCENVTVIEVACPDADADADARDEGGPDTPRDEAGEAADVVDDDGADADAPGEDGSDADGNRLCLDYTIDCEPSCEGRTCGFNGCSDSCGSCGPGEYCRLGSCAEPSGTPPQVVYEGSYFRWLADPAATRGDISWGYVYMDSVYRLYVDLFGFGLDGLPREITIDPSDSCPGGIGGWASGGNLGFCAGDWGFNHYCAGILGHELANTFTGRVTGCWPVEWWADHRSPLPLLASTVAMRMLGYGEMADEREAGVMGDPLYVMFRNWHERYCFDIYNRTFGKMMEEGIDLCSFTEPDVTCAVIAFLEWAAGADLTEDLVRAGVAVDRARVDHFKDEYGLR